MVTIDFRAVWGLLLSSQVDLLAGVHHRRQTGTTRSGAPPVAVRPPRQGLPSVPNRVADASLRHGVAGKEERCQPVFPYLPHEGVRRAF